MLNLDNVYEKVKTCLIDSCGLEEAQIELNKTLIEDLGVDSIDLLDLIYTLERQYSISIGTGEFANLAAKDMGDKPFEIDNVVTEEGLKILHKFIGESQKERIQKGLTVQEIPTLLTVQSVCNLVLKKIAAEGKSTEI